MNNTEVKDIIKSQRLKLGLSYSELGRLCGVDKTTVRKWELGLIENMKRDKMVLLSKALDVPPLVLLGIENNISKDIKVHSNDRISVYADIFANKLENPIAEINNPYQSLKGNFFALEFSNVTITKLLTDTKVYAIFKQQSVAENGTIVAVTIANDKALVKRFYKFDDVIVLRSTTTEDDSTITLVANQINDMCILGSFVGIVSPFENR